MSLSSWASVTPTITTISRLIAMPILCQSSRCRIAREMTLVTFGMGLRAMSVGAARRIAESSLPSVCNTIVTSRGGVKRQVILRRHAVTRLRYEIAMLSYAIR